MQLAYNVSGQGHPLLILHGLFGCYKNWSSLQRQLAGYYRVYALDLPNHGASDALASMNYSTMASAVADFMRGQHINCASILGHSMGGKVAMQFACDYPQQVAKLLVVDIAPKIYPPHHQEILAALLDLDLSSFTSRQQIDKVLAQHIPQLALRQFLLTNLYKNQQGGFSWRFHLANIVNNYTHICAAPSLRQPYSGPSLFIRGEQSNYIRPADSTVITQHFPQVQIVSLANAGHWLHVEQPVDFLAQVTGFIG